MSHMHFHAESSARKFGGKPEDYYPLHSWFDETKELFGDFRHRALRHHAQGIYKLERKFGVTITNSDGKKVPVRLVGEQHVREDCGNRIPSVQDWLSQIYPQRWMNAGCDQYQRNVAAGIEEGTLSLYIVSYIDGDDWSRLIWADSPTQAVQMWRERLEFTDEINPDHVHLLPRDKLLPPEKEQILAWNTDIPNVTP